ncbi:MAG: SDR family NAD(P)-dependent oxidoreductase, partial [Chitinophagales bacterium]|nr:SDR family NAD(P)-dependent oxidoreductase [Hyphomicrobiales bacterium]
MSAANRSTVAFITGGGSGIGAGLAKAFHARGAKVVIGGRNLPALEAVAQAHAGIETVHIDVADATSVTRCVDEIAERFPKLNMLVNNAGVQRLLDFNAAPPSAAEIAEEIDINLKGLIHVTAAFLPLLRRQSAARIIHVSSGLAFVPLASAPVYSATKAAVHSFALSLRKQLAGTAVLVIELIPPLVET